MWAELNDGSPEGLHMCKTFVAYWAREVPLPNWEEKTGKYTTKLYSLIFAWKDEWDRPVKHKFASVISQPKDETDTPDMWREGMVGNVDGAANQVLPWQG
ncbi:MAG: hypothetical protein M1820_007117 [Bogoriella megaspora]|nr:MAG: hypothetical protein M1820_007117 [Bogoriella megaspora]